MHFKNGLPPNLLVFNKMDYSQSNPLQTLVALLNVWNIGLQDSWFRRRKSTEKPAKSIPEATSPPRELN
jgi:hypothetical protein